MLKCEVPLLKFLPFIVAAPGGAGEGGWAGRGEDANEASDVGSINNGDDTNCHTINFHRQHFADLYFYFSYALSFTLHSPGPWGPLPRCLASFKHSVFNFAFVLF